MQEAMPRRGSRSRVLRPHGAQPAARRRRRPTDRSTTDRDQAGYTLIEVVIAVAITGLVILSLATAMLAIVRTNALNSDRQRVDAAMTSFSESVQAGAYEPCGDAGHYNTVYFDPVASPDSWTVPDGVTARVEQVDYWDPGASTYVGSCGQDAGAQRLTLSVSWGELTRQAQIVKRAPS